MNATHIQVQPFQPTQQAWMPAPAPAVAATAYRPPANVPTVTKVRWGRIVLGLAAAAMLTCGMWTTFGGRATPSASLTAAANRSELAPLTTASADATTVAAGGAATSTKQGKPGAGLPDAATSEAVVDASVDTGAPQKITVPTAAAPAPSTDMAPMKDMSPSTDATAPMKTTAPSDPVVGGGGTPDAAPSISEPNTAPAVARRTPTVRGGGTAELPYTGAETWIVAILGITVLLAGILIQINAVRIGMTAMLYRRGILLRPVDCARLLANGQSMARVRVAISNALHYLLTEPAGADFVTAR